uniref:Peroxisomal membrane protein MPV17 n=1 Tax=Aureoumbra lagunensis TaxID=44058 RepID=A0A7S3JYE7_9STRA
MNFKSVFGACVFVLHARSLQAWIQPQKNTLMRDGRSVRFLAQGRRVAPRTRMLAAPAELWGGYLQALESAPLITKCLTATVIIGAGDATAQAIEGSKKKTNIDIKRVARWALFGLILQAPWNHYYQNALEAAIPSTADPWTLTTAFKVAVDQFFQAPIFTTIIFYFFAIVEGRGLPNAKRQVETELWPTLLKNWIIFIPATAVNLGIIPLEFRVLFIK